MNGYKNYDDEDFNLGNLNNQGTSPDEYTPTTYDNGDFYELYETGTTNYEQSSDEQTYNGQFPTQQNYNEPAFNGQFYNQQTYDEPAFNGQSYQQPNYDEPVFNGQSYQQPNYDEPVFNGQSYQQPNNDELSYNGQSYQQSYDDYEEEDLTEAELEDIKRQKAAERRKKLAARERRRKKRMKQAIIRCSLLLLAITLVILGLVKIVTGVKNYFEKEKQARELSEFLATSEATTEEPIAIIKDEILAKEIPTDRDAALLILTEQAQNDADMQGICDNAATLPDSVLKHLAANFELKDFAIMYPAKINIVFDGDFTVEQEDRKVPLYLQYDERWGYADYSNNLIALSGSGPTTLSMACTYLTQDGSMNPVKIADYATEHGYLDADGNTDWSLMTDGAVSLGLDTTEINVGKKDMIDALEEGKLLICKMSAGDFTTTQHYILITEYKDGLFVVHDPASKARSEVSWDYKRLSKQISKMCTAKAGSENTSNPSQIGNSSGDAASGDAEANN